jgi:hypothetical protein
MPERNNKRRAERRRGPANAGRGARPAKKSTPGRFEEALTIARQSGLLEGARTRILRGRMPKALVERAKARSGADSDTQLIEVALANLAVADEYPAWLLSQTGTVSEDLDLEF